jgi:plasmid stabilization system protein ParE
LLPEAVEDYQAALGRYDLTRSSLGDAFAVEIEQAFKEIAQNPRLFPKIESTRSEREFHSYLLHRFPYVVHYLITTDEIVVFAVAHMRRRPDYWVGRKS